jgi:hypothetical protein
VAAVTFQNTKPVRCEFADGKATPQAFPSAVGYQGRSLATTFRSHAGTNLTAWTYTKRVNVNASVLNQPVEWQNPPNESPSTQRDNSDAWLRDFSERGSSTGTSISEKSF